MKDHNCNILSFEVEPIFDVSTNYSIGQFFVYEDNSDQPKETQLWCCIPLNHEYEWKSLEYPSNA